MSEPSAANGCAPARVGRLCAYPGGPWGAFHTMYVRMEGADMYVTPLVGRPTEGFGPLVLWVVSVLRVRRDVREGAYFVRWNK